MRVTAPETFGVSYLAPRLAAFGLEHPGLTIELGHLGPRIDRVLVAARGAVP